MSDINAPIETFDAQDIVNALAVLDNLPCYVQIDGKLHKIVSVATDKNTIRFVGRIEPE